MMTLSSTAPVLLPPHHRNVFPVAAKPPKIDRDVPDVNGSLWDTTSSHPLGRNSPREATTREGTARRRGRTRRYATPREDTARRRGRTRRDDEEGRGRTQRDDEGGHSVTTREDATRQRGRTQRDSEGGRGGTARQREWTRRGRTREDAAQRRGHNCVDWDVGRGRGQKGGGRLLIPPSRRHKIMQKQKKHTTINHWHWDCRKLAKKHNNSQMGNGRRVTTIGVAGETVGANMLGEDGSNLPAPCRGSATVTTALRPLWSH